MARRLRKPSAKTQKETKWYDDLQNVNWWVLVVAVVVVGGAALISRSQRAIPGTSAYAAQQPAPTAVIPDEPNTDEGDDAISAFPTSAPVDYQTWDAPPELIIDPETIDYQAVIKLPTGDVTLDLYEEQTPITVNNFVFLANEGYYDGVTFHRVIPGFVAQGGDPTGTGTGGPGYQFEDEIVEDLVFDRAGLLAMANAGPGTNGSQFFITYAETPWLDGLHTIFGEVIDGFDLIVAIPERDPATSFEPGVAMETIEIVELPKE